jgi:hypothetical protein
MSTGGIFKLITNDGIQDKLLMATDYLSIRLKLIAKVNKQRAQTNIDGNIDLNASWIPTINSISKSHVIFTNGAFKPFVASGFEYNKVLTTASAQFGSSTKFSLPQFGDFINDIVLHVKLSGLAVKNPQDRVRYVSLLGHKLMSHVSFKINNNPLDDYGSDDYNAFYQFHVKPEKRVGWLRNMGQEIPNQAYLTADPAFDMHREYRWFGDGNQTFKQSHDEVELWIPLLFWFREVHNALPNGAIPFGQTDITIKFASVSEVVGFANYGGGGAYTEPTISLCEMYVNNIFMNTDIANIFIEKFGFSLIRVHNSHKVVVSKSSDDMLLYGLKWPTECLYVAFRPRSNLDLSQQWHLSSNLEVRDIKVPVVAKNTNSSTVGTVDVGLITPTTNTVSLTYVGGVVLSTLTNFYVNYDFVITGGTGYDVSNVTNNRYKVTAYNEVTKNITISGIWKTGVVLDATTTFELFTPQVAINVARYYKETPAINTLEIKAHGIVIFSETSESFFNSYLPYRYGNNMNTPRDRGWYLINFNFFPGEHQPSGHINLSTTREFYLRYSSTSISDTSKSDMIVLSDAINFLLIKNGSAVLRYST